MLYTMLYTEKIQIIKGNCTGNPKVEANWFLYEPYNTEIQQEVELLITRAMFLEKNSY